MPREGKKKCQQRPAKLSEGSRDKARRYLYLHIQADFPREHHLSPQQPLKVGRTSPVFMMRAGAQE